MGLKHAVLKKRLSSTGGDENEEEVLTKPRLILHGLLITIQIVIVMMAALGNRWPMFCTQYAWAHFVLTGNLISSTILVVFTFLSTIIFEELNWVFMSCLLFLHGSQFIICGCLYVVTTATGCERESDTEDRESDMLVDLEESVGYISLILGIFYFACLIYYLVRKERA